MVLSTAVELERKSPVKSPRMSSKYFMKERCKTLYKRNKIKKIGKVTCEHEQLYK